MSSNVKDISIIGFILFGCIYGLLIVFFFINRYLSKKSFCKNNEKLIAFFHPYCNSGGGGERALWMMISSIYNYKALHDSVVIIIYTGDVGISPIEILNNVNLKFGINFPPNACKKIQFVFIRSRPLLEAKRYPVLTMIGQSLASIVVVFECALRATPDVYVDTTGAAFPYPLVRLLTGARVAAYVHYPTISQDMLSMVRERRPCYNNRSHIAGSTSVSMAKLYYYRLFAAAYGVAGRSADLVMVNSSWTEKHIRALWGDARVVKVYPPCDTTRLLDLPLAGRQRLILSVGQFRPEKDHSLQLRFADVKLVLLGGSRGANDEGLLRALRTEAFALGVQDATDFCVNAPFSKLIEYLSLASVGLHTMWNEHFGISVVEMMAAGLVVVAHKSGGPLEDIICTDEKNRTGFLADSPESYADCLEKALDSYANDEHTSIRSRARRSVLRFSDDVYEKRTQQEFVKLIHDN